MTTLLIIFGKDTSNNPSVVVNEAPSKMWQQASTQSCVRQEKAAQRRAKPLEETEADPSIRYRCPQSGHRLVTRHDGS